MHVVNIVVLLILSTCMAVQLLVVIFINYVGSCTEFCSALPPYSLVSQNAFSSHPHIKEEKAVWLVRPLPSSAELIIIISSVKQIN